MKFLAINTFFKEFIPLKELIRRQQISGDKRTEEEMISEYLKLKEIVEFGYENQELFDESDYKLKIKKWIQ